MRFAENMKCIDDEGEKTNNKLKLHMDGRSEEYMKYNTIDYLISYSKDVFIS